MGSRYFNTQRKGDHHYCWKKILQQFGGTKGGVLMFDTIAKWWSPEILQLCDAKNPLHLEVFWNHMDSDPGFWNPRKPYITNDRLENPPWMTMYFLLEHGGFFQCHVSFSGVYQFSCPFLCCCWAADAISKPGAMSYGSISMEVRPFFFGGKVCGFPLVVFLATSKKDP